MDWLRSEDLKEERNVTASIMIIAGEVSCTLACHDYGNRLLGAKAEHPSTARPANAVLLASPNTLSF